MTTPLPLPDDPRPTVAALFVDPRGVYSEAPDVEIWDEAPHGRECGLEAPAVVADLVAEPRFDSRREPAPTLAGRVRDHGPRPRVPRLGRSRVPAGYFPLMIPG